MDNNNKHPKGTNLIDCNWRTSIISRDYRGVTPNQFIAMKKLKHAFQEAKVFIHE